MLNSGEKKISRFVRQKEKNIPPPCKLNGRSLRYLQNKRKRKHHFYELSHVHNAS